MLSDLKTKIGLILALLWILCSLSAYFVIDRVVLPSFVQLERDAAQTDLHRIEEGLNREIEGLDIFCYDYASWDDACRYIAEPDDGFIANNLSETTFRSSRFNFVYLIDNAGRIVWSRSYEFDPDTGEATERVLADLPACLFPADHPLLVDTGALDESGLAEARKTGMVRLDGHDTLFATRPILTSDAKGPVRGTLLMGRFLTDELAQSIRDMTQLDFSLERVLDTSYPAAARPLDLTSPVNRYTVALDNSDRVRSSLLLCDTAGRPLLLAVVDRSAEIIRKGRHAVRFTVLFLALLFIGVMATLRRVINRIVIAPINSLTGHIQSIIQTGNLQVCLTSSRNDQIGLLTRQYNQMLRELDRKNQLLELASVTDGMTGIFNQTHSIERLNQEIVRCRRTGGSLSLGIVDIDKFKAINDTCGHQIGDKAIIVAAAFLLAGLRDGDILGRYGGDEFIILFVGQNVREADGVMEGICRQIERMNMLDTGIPVTISAGIQGWEGQSAGQIIAQADELLYLAKTNGRNQVQSRQGNLPVEGLAH